MKQRRLEQGLVRFLDLLGPCLIGFVAVYWLALLLWAWQSGAIERLVTR